MFILFMRSDIMHQQALRVPSMTIKRHERSLKPAALIHCEYGHTGSIIFNGIVEIPSTCMEIWLIGILAHMLYHAILPAPST